MIGRWQIWRSLRLVRASLNRRAGCEVQCRPSVFQSSWVIWVCRRSSPFDSACSKHVSEGMEWAPCLSGCITT